MEDGSVLISSLVNKSHYYIVIYVYDCRLNNLLIQTTLGKPITIQLWTVNQCEFHPTYKVIHVVSEDRWSLQTGGLRYRLDFSKRWKTISSISNIQT